MALQIRCFSCSNVLSNSSGFPIFEKDALVQKCLIYKIFQITGVHWLLRQEDISFLCSYCRLLLIQIYTLEQKFAEAFKSAENVNLHNTCLRCFSILEESSGIPILENNALIQKCMIYKLYQIIGNKELLEREDINFLCANCRTMLIQIYTLEQKFTENFKIEKQTGMMMVEEGTEDQKKIDDETGHLKRINKHIKQINKETLHLKKSIEETENMSTFFQDFEINQTKKETEHVPIETGVLKTNHVPDKIMETEEGANDSIRTDINDTKLVNVSDKENFETNNNSDQNEYLENILKSYDGFSEREKDFTVSEIRMKMGDHLHMLGLQEETPKNVMEENPKNVKVEEKENHTNYVNELKKILPQITKMPYGDKHHVCIVCQKAFPKRSQLTSHETIHQERRFKCNQCSKYFTHGHALTRHRRTHTGEKPFACEICSKSFNDSGNLKTHRRTHLTELPFKCDRCERSFAQKINLQNHVRRGHFEGLGKALNLTS